MEVKNPSKSRPGSLGKGGFVLTLTSFWSPPQPNRAPFFSFVPAPVESDEICGSTSQAPHG